MSLCRIGGRGTEKGCCKTLRKLLKIFGEKAEEEEKRRKERNERIPCNKRDGSRDSRDKEKEYLRENKQMRRSGGESGMPEEEEEVNNDNESAAGVGGGIDASRGKHRNLE